MKKIAIVIPALLLLLGFGAGPLAWAQSEPIYYETSPSEADLISPEELDDLLAPIALYPDPLIAQILPAATFVDQIDEAARYVRQYGRNARIDDQRWDVSVKAVAHYPDVLFMMDQRQDWTIALGQAYIDQPQDVMDAIQALRADARARGNLYSTQQQQVIVEDDYIRIVPATAEYVYVPVYDPETVYVESYGPTYPLITFGVGFAIGAWLSRDCDWRGHRVYYHGWRGGGWVSRARPHIHDSRGIYINKRASVINVNNRVLQRDTRQFRQQLSTDTVRRRAGHPTRPPGGTNQPRPAVNQPRPGREPRPGRVDQQRAPVPGTVPGVEQRAPASGRQRTPEAGQQRAPGTAGTRTRPTGRGGAPAATGQKAAPATIPPTAPATAPATAPPAVVTTPPTATGQPTVPGTGRPRRPDAGARPEAGSRPAAKPGATEVFRGRDVQKTQPASQSGYGGYGSSKDATIYRQRGQSSRENMRQINRPPATPRSQAAPAPAAAPAPRPAASPPARQPHQSIQRPAASVPPAPRPAPVAPVAPRAAAPVAPRAVVPAAPRAVAPVAPRPATPAAPAMRPAVPMQQR